MHPPGCALRAYSDANTNEKNPWKESVTGRNIIRLKGSGATLDIQQRYDGASDKMVPVVDATVQLLLKILPPGKNFRSKQGEVVLNNVNTTKNTTATAMVEDQRPPCCRKNNGGISESLIPATLRLRNNATVIHVLIDTGCLQTNIINTRVANLLNADGGTLYKTDIILTAGVGGLSYGVQGVMNLTITLTNNDNTQRHIFLRAIVCRDVLIRT
jgi:hypothetical protein